MLFKAVGSLQQTDGGLCRSCHKIKDGCRIGKLVTIDGAALYSIAI